MEQENTEKPKEKKYRAYKCKSEPDFNISPEDMYMIENKQYFSGIEGYNPGVQYFDYKEALWKKRRTEIKNKHISVWPPMNWKEDKITGKKMPPVKTNFIDDQIKWATSFFDKEKAAKTIEEIMAKNNGQPIPEFNYSSFPPKRKYVDLKEKFKQNEAEQKLIKQRMKSVPDFKEHAVEAVLAKIKEEESNGGKTKFFKPNFPKCDRVTCVADAEYVGESIPFYNTPPQDDKNPEKNKLFFPSLECVWRRSPSWGFNARTKMGKEKNKEENKYIEARDQYLKEKAEKALEKSNIDLKKYQEEPALSFKKVHDHGKCVFTIRKPFNYETSQYKTAKENNISYSPGPNHYWDDGKACFNRKNKNDDKEYIMSKEKTYKRVNIPYLRKSVY